MCDYCDESGYKKAQRIANDLADLRAMYQALADGRLRPHGDGMKTMDALSRRIIRDLVDDTL
jgi:hypothetical protein